MKALFCLLGLVLTCSLTAQTRVGVVDIAVDPVLVNEREALVDELRQVLAARSPFEVLRKAEIEAALNLKNPLDEREAELRTDHKNYYQEVLRELDAARNLYRSSDFSKLISLLNSIFPNLDSAAMSLDEAQVKEILGLLAVAEYFLGQRGRSDALLTALFDFDSDHVFPSNIYPSGIISRFNQIRSQRTPATKQVLVRTNVRDFEIQFLGKRLEMKTENGLSSFSAPIENEILANFSLVFTKDGYASQIFPANDIPERVVFEELGARPIRTKAVFDVLNSLSASEPLKNVMSKVDASLFLLAHATKDLNDVWVIRAQWMTQSASRRSPVLKAENLDRRIAVELIVEKLLAFLGPDGEIVSDLESWAIGDPVVDDQPRADSKPFYKEWWFWTLVGAAGAGAGVGTYFLVKPEDKTRFVVEPSN